MAEKQSFPVFSEKNWWALRKQFRLSVPKDVSSTYLKSLFGLTSNEAATTNLLNLRNLGLLDDENRPTPLANEWRIDESYKSSCEKLLTSVYPNELLELFPDASADRNRLKNWFMTKCEVGDNAAGQMAALFLILRAGDVKEPQSQTGTSAKPTKPKRSTSSKLTNPVSQAQSEQKSVVNNTESRPKTFDISTTYNRPNLHIDLQIHISPESTPEQIEAIFASMSKHLYGVDKS